MGQIFRPTSLPSRKVLGVAKIYEVLVVGDHVDGSQGTFKVVPPLLEGLEYSKEFLVMDVVVLFSVSCGQLWRPELSQLSLYQRLTKRTR